jgi:hypothetical protein
MVFRLTRARRRRLAFKVARLIAQKITSDPTERGVAYRDYDNQISKAWKAALEFSNALYMAYVAGETRLLRDYVAAGQPVPQDMRVPVNREPDQSQVFVAGKPDQTRGVDALIAELLGRSSPDEQPPALGRPPRVANRAPPTEQAERNAAWLVAFVQKRWLKHSSRKRVPHLKTDEMISDAIKEATKEFRVPVSSIRESNVRNLLRNLQVVVH